MRVPFPVRVFLSYLLIVIVGTLPTYIFIQTQFPKNWFLFKTKNVAAQAHRLASLLSRYPLNHRLAELRILSKTYNERLTYINSRGIVLFDSAVSKVKQMGNHSTRKEIRLLRGEAAPREAFDPMLKGVGVARRLSKTADQNMLYVAVYTNPEKGKNSDVLRLAVPLESLNVLISSFLAVFRNSQATALTVALLLSLVAAVVFMRPLQRILAAAQALARGEYNVELGNMAKDEVGDVGRALEQLAIKLRKRLARADTAKVLLLQLIKSIPTPLVLFGADGQVIGLNASARALFEDDAQSAEHTLSLWSSTADYAQKLTESDDTGEPQKVKLYLPKTEKKVRGLLCALKHPTSKPFAALMGDVTGVAGKKRLPRPEEVTVVEVKSLVDDAVERSKTSYQLAKTSLRVPNEWPNVRLADAKGRLPVSLTLLLEGAILSPTNQENLSLEYEEEEGKIVFLLNSRVPSFVVALIGQCVEPLGGSIKREAGECQLTLPKA